MSPRLSSMPLLPVLVGVVAGIVAGMAGLSLWWIAALLPVATVSYIYFNDFVGIALLASIVGLVASVVSRPVEPPIEPDGSVVWCRGVVTDVGYGDSSRRLLVDVQECGLDSLDVAECRKFKVVVFVGSLLPTVDPGSRVCISARLNRPASHADLPYEVDYAARLRSQGIVATAFVSSADIHLIGSDRSLYWRLRGFRQSVSDLIMRSSLNPATACFVNAVLLGDTSLIPERIRSSFSSAGLAHLLALSGMHVGIIALVISVALFPLRVLQLNRLPLLLTVAVLWAYAVMTGMSPSVVRAVIMATLLVMGQIFRRRSSPVNNLCMAALLILIFDPASLVAPGFQLSFVAVAAILILSPLLNPVDRRNHPVLFLLVSWIAVSVSAVIGTGLLAAYYFHTYPLYFLFGNMIAMLVMPLAMSASILLVAVEAFGVDPLWLCRCVDALYGIMAWSADVVSGLYGSRIDRLYFPAWTLLPYAVAVAMLALALARRRIFYLCGMGVALIAAFAVMHLTGPEFPAYEHFVTRNAYRTDIVVRDGHDVYLLTTATVAEREAVARECTRRYAGYLGRVGADSIVCLPDTFVTGAITRAGSLLAIGADTYIVLHKGNSLPPALPHVRYALVCRGYTGPVDNLDTIADTILLSRDLPAKLHDRHLRRLTALSIPHRTLRAPFRDAL